MNEKLEFTIRENYSSLRKSEKKLLTIFCLIREMAVN